jgi:hypothetical protein
MDISYQEYCNQDNMGPLPEPIELGATMGMNAKRPTA